MKNKILYLFYISALLCGTRYVFASSDSVPVDLKHPIIKNITITNLNVFNLDIDAEDKSLYRLLNQIHINTKKDVIRNQLLFELGDIYSKRIADETERLLRSNRYLTSADVFVENRLDGGVNLNVKTLDSWTLNPGFSFGRGGGHNRTSLSLREHNLLGSGARIGLRYKSDIDRDSTTFQISDNNFMGTRLSYDLDYGNNSDGQNYLARLSSPFYSLDTKHSYGLKIENQSSIESLFDLGEVKNQYRYRAKRLDIFNAFSSGLKDDRVKRYSYGVALEDHTYSMEATAKPFLEELSSSTRRHIYPYIGIEILEDSFIEEKNLDNIGLIEDRHIGSRFHAKLGYASSKIDASSDAWYFRAGYSNSLVFDQNRTLMFTSLLESIIEETKENNIKLSMNARYDIRHTSKRLLHLELDIITAQNLNANELIYLGGDNKLRGYPARYQTGDKRIVFTIEQRYFTDWYPFRIARIGGAVFMDIGKTWEHEQLNSSQMGWLKSIGFGLRIANSRSEIGRVLHIDIAYPIDGGSDLDKLQLLIDAKKGF